jgi:hypothetical protein
MSATGKRLAQTVGFRTIAAMRRGRDDAIDPELSFSADSQAHSKASRREDPLVQERP